MRTSYYHSQNSSEINKRNEDPQCPLESHLHLQRSLAILMMKYSKPKTKALKNSKSLAYKAGKIRNSKATRMNSKLKALKSSTTLKRYIIYSKKLFKTVKRRRKLSDNDMLRLVIQNEELPDAISTKFNKVQYFKLGDLETIINILEYRSIQIEKCKIVVQSVKIPTGKGRLYPTKDTVSRKSCIITV